ncbi:MAG: Methyltransferase domain protein [Acidimicrobiales bacterium]|nr:Methyltransferase domain protein [Acidimicrobiales bacterium]
MTTTPPHGDGAPRVTLADAYALVTPDDSRALYARWAATYESDFVEDTGYLIPDRVAEEFADVAGQLDGTVLDVGCGTGLVAFALVRDTAGEGVNWVIDGADISPEMLVVAADKQRPDGRPLYRRLIEVDLTADLSERTDLLDARYAAVVSAGTFTHGHLGPESLAALVPLGRPGAIFAIGINFEHFEARGFAQCLAGLLESGQIRNLDPRIVEMYRPGSSHDGDQAVVAIFRRA